nr:hypothetical protein Iba_chr12aCG0310 [Ipomoea batatas]
MAICMAMEAAEAGVDGIGIGMVFGVAFPPIPETFLMGVVDNEAGVSLSSSLSLILSIIFAEVVLNESEDMGDRGFLCVESEKTQQPFQCVVFGAKLLPLKFSYCLHLQQNSSFRFVMDCALIRKVLPVLPSAVPEASSADNLSIVSVLTLFKADESPKVGWISPMTQQPLAAAEHSCGLPDPLFFYMLLGTPVQVDRASYPFQSQALQSHPIFSDSIKNIAIEYQENVQT